MNKCPDCGKEVSKSAKTCPNCGKKLKKPVVLYVVLAIFIIGIFGAAVSDKDTNSNSNSTNNSAKEKKVIEYTKVDIDELEDALDNNPAAAKDTYDGKYLEITGRLGTIDSDLKYISILSTTDEWDILGVHCTIKNSATKDVVKSLTKGQTIIVKGKITDVGEVLGYYLDIDEIITQ